MDYRIFCNMRFSLQDVKVSACTSGRGQLVLGDEEGSLYFVSRQLDVSSFHAYELCVTHLYQLKQHNILVTVGVRIFYVNHLQKNLPLVILMTFFLCIGMVMEFICAKFQTW